MTFWHYHWALIRARELELTTRERFVFAHMGAVASPTGAVASSVKGMALDLGLDRRDLGRAVRKLWTLGALYSVGKSSGGRGATVYQLVPEPEARAIVENERAATPQPQPGQGAPRDMGQGAPCGADMGQGAPRHVGQGAPVGSTWGKAPQVYEPRLRPELATWGKAPRDVGQGAPQVGQGAPPNNKQSNNHESPTRKRRPYTSSADRWKDWRARA